MPLVATADAHYLCSEDAHAHDVLFCINTRQMHDPRKKKYPEERMPNPYYVRSPEDMYKLFPNHQDAVARSQQIADSVDIELDFKKRHFPVFITPDAKSPEAYLRELCERGMYERYGAEPSDAVRKRLDHELGIINKMGFSTYFLIVWDFVRFAREEGIPCTARGSGCGAIVCYLLYMSHVCPLEYDLLFERFLDPNRSRSARHRHRLLPGAARAGHRLREAEVRREVGGADRHVRHARGEGGAEGRGPRAGPDRRSA